MLALKKTLETLAGQLRGFSLTAKLLVGALMVILVMGLVLVGAVAGRTEMVPLGLGADVGPDVRARAVGYLNQRGIRWSEGEGELLVPAEQRYAVLAQLTENRLITGDQIDFTAIMKDDSPFTDRATRKARFLVVKMNEVARMIGEMSGVERATVVIDQPERSGGLGAARVEPSASVTVLARGDHLAQGQADAIARLVAGAHAELKVENVTVVDARIGRAMLSRSDDDLPATRDLETKLAHEKIVKATIEEALSVFPGVVVAVNAQVDATEEVRDSTTYADPKSGLQEESVLERTTTARGGRGEPGVRPNTGLEIAAASDARPLLADNRSNARLVNAFGSSASRQRDPRGYPVKINATVLVPESYLVTLHRQRTGDDEAEPDTTALGALADELRTEIRRLVEPLIDTGAVANAVPGKVVVSLFADVSMPGFGPAGGGAGLGGGALGGGLVSEGLLRSVVLGGLALVSLLLMMMMVRKATREEEMPTAEELVGIPPALAETDGDLVGEADESVAAMEGVEIDEGAVRRQQMIDQINDLALTSPDEAASLLRKWIKNDG